MKFLDVVYPKAIVPELEGSSRDDVIKELVDALDKAGAFGGQDADSIVKAVIKRENEASTGIGKGVAVPHVKYDGLNKTIMAIGRSSSGVNFLSLDKQPVYSIMLLISSADDPDKHLQAMEMIFKYLQQEKFRKFLRQSETTEEILDLLKEADEDQSF